jgi:hypothetical protein
MEAGSRTREPVRLDTRVIVGRRDDRSFGGVNPGVQRGVPPLLRLVKVVQGRGKSSALRLDDRSGVIGGPVVDDQEFPVADDIQFRDATNRLA